MQIKDLRVASAPPLTSPLQAYLHSLHTQFRDFNAGRVATYIPELAHADPAGFGIALATVDGHVYEVGDSRRAFTIQSISKAFSYGLALEDRGVDAVLKKVDVEPSGEAFNSISLHPVSGRPRNPMINAGAIATCGLLLGDSPDQRVARLLALFERLTGRTLIIDEKVYLSERATGHRNRALAHLMYGFGILEQPPEDVLEVYFRQCAILVNSRDLALAGASLANAGVNPRTGTRALSREHVPKVLSVMSSCGMYDASGTWLFNIGMPAKSGVGGGILAVLPGQLALAVYSPALDEQGNSARGIAVCEAFSRDFNLHLFKSIRATSTSVVRARYGAEQIGSRRARSPRAQSILQEHARTIRIYQLQGELLLGSAEALLSQVLAEAAHAEYFVLDLKRVSHVSHAAARLLHDLTLTLAGSAKTLLLTATHDDPVLMKALSGLQDLLAVAPCAFQDDDHAVQWCEDQLLSKYGYRPDPPPEIAAVDSLAAVLGIPPTEIDALRAVAIAVTFAPQELVVAAGQPALSMFVVASGELEVFLTLANNHEKRLTTLAPGMTFGEMALVNRALRTANVRALVNSTCYEIAFSALHDSLRAHLLKNLAADLSQKLVRFERELRLVGVA